MTSITLRRTRDQRVLRCAKRTGRTITVTDTSMPHENYTCCCTSTAEAKLVLLTYVQAWQVDDADAEALTLEIV